MEQHNIRDALSALLLHTTEPDDEYPYAFVVYFETPKELEIIETILNYAEHQNYEIVNYISGQYSNEKKYVLINKKQK